MAVVIRLSRVGKNKQAYYRVVVADSRAKKEGRIVDQVGHYNQVKEPPTMKFNESKVIHWLQCGACPTETVRQIFKKAGLWQKFIEQKKQSKPVSA